MLFIQGGLSIATEVSRGFAARHPLALVICTLVYWVAVKELKLSYYIGGTILIAIYTHYGNLI